MPLSYEFSVHPVEGWTENPNTLRVKPFMVRQACPKRSRRAHHERFNLTALGAALAKNESCRNIEGMA
jgi:hypothetical protein